MLERLDKFLSQTGNMTRSEAKEALKKKKVTVNGVTVQKGELKINPETDAVAYMGTALSARLEEYYLLHKPAGCITATEDGQHRTVMEYLPKGSRAVPVGRLDKDTTGLLLLTTDGDYNHQLMSPRKHVPKTYRALVSGVPTPEELSVLANGIAFQDFTSQPADCKVCSVNGDGNAICELTITEGKFHQVKRMFAYISHPVLSLSRIGIGRLCLDETMPEGTCRKVSKEWLRAMIEEDASPLLAGKKAVIFDLDGTLVDSMWMWREIDVEYLGQFGIEMPERLQEDIEGKGFHELAVYFKERFSLCDSIETIKNDWNRMAYDKYATKVFPKAGVREFLAGLKEAGIKIGIATSNSRELLELVLRQTGLLSFFDGIHTCCEVTRGKPYPDIYLYVAKQLGVRPEECLVFEDVAAGITAGKAAGMQVVCVWDRDAKQGKGYLQSIADGYITDFQGLLGAKEGTPQVGRKEETHV